MTVQFKVVESTVQRDSAIRMTQVVQQFATMLVGRNIGVRLSDATFAPAWSTSNTIEFSEPQLPDLQTKDGIISVRGLTFHELSHILYTPRAQSDIALWVTDNGLSRAFNALEDQRIETLITARYGALKLWLTATMSQYLLNSPEAITRAFPLVRGRKYLPVEVRKLAKEFYENQQDVAELSSIIDEYRLLLFPQDTEQAKPLIARYAELVKNLPDTGKGLPDPFGHESRPDQEQHSGIGNKPLSKPEQERDRNRARKQDEQTENEDEFEWGSEPQDESNDSDEESDGNSDEPSDSSDGEQSDTDGSDSSDNESTDGDGEPADSNSDSDSDGEPSDNESDSNSDGQSAGLGQADQDRVEDVLQDVLDSIEQSLGSAIADELAKFGGDVVLQGIPARTPARAYNQPATVSAGAVQASVAFKQELLKLKQEHDPAWDYKTRKGRLNALRYAQGYDIDELFDKFDHGRADAVDIEAVILLDVSGSMSGENIRRANESLWGIKTALDSIGASCTAVTFNDEARLLYSADETVSSVMRYASAMGGTNPLSALQYANYVLASSDRKVKLLFVITDGEWVSSERSERIIRNLRDGGVVTTLAYISGHAQDINSVNRHECEAVAHVTNASDLLTVGKTAVKLAIARNLVSA